LLRTDDFPAGGRRCWSSPRVVRARVSAAAGPPTAVHPAGAGLLRAV